jgi:regulatory protein
MGSKRGASSSPPSLKALAVGYLSRREYSRLELRGRLLAAATRASAKCLSPATSLAGAGVEPPIDVAVEEAMETRVDRSAEVDALLDWLEARGYLNDARFAETRVHARAARHGTLRIRQELGRHGVELGAEQAAALRATEFARAKAVWDRKFKAPAADARGRASQARFLLGRGFSAEVVRRIVGGDDDPSP